MKKELLLNLIENGYADEKKYNESVTDIINELWKEQNFELARLIKEIQANNQRVIKNKKDNKNNFKTLFYPEKIVNEIENIQIGYKKNLIKKILLKGRPGTGKTSFVHMLVNKMKLKLISIKLSDIMDYKYGESIKKLETIMETYSNEKCIIFFDEAESLFSSRFIKNDINETSRILTTMLKILDNETIALIVFATNLFNSLDKAFIRRMDDVIDFDCYSKLEYNNILDDLILKYDINLDEFEKGLIIENITKKQTFFSPSSLKNLCKKIAINNISSKYENLEIINNFFSEVTNE